MAITIDKIPRYSDLSSRIHGDKVKIATLVGVPIVIWKFDIRDSIYRKDDKDPNKNYVRIEFSFESDITRRYVTGTSSYYLIEDLQSVQKNLPIRATIVHQQLRRRNPTEKIRYAYILN